jgi:hypothetical protein
MADVAAKVPLPFSIDVLTRNSTTIIKLVHDITKRVSLP